MFRGTLKKSRLLRGLSINLAQFQNDCKSTMHGSVEWSNKMAAKAATIKRFSSLKLVKETTVLREHDCTPECFKPKRRRTAPNLQRVSLGYIYASSNGRFYHPW